VAQKQKAQSEDWAKRLNLLLIFGRGGGIRTRDPLHPIKIKLNLSQSNTI
jgi:hypothetical protein